MRKKAAFYECIWLLIYNAIRKYTYVCIGLPNYMNQKLNTNFRHWQCGCYCHSTAKSGIEVVLKVGQVNGA